MRPLALLAQFALAGCASAVNAADVYLYCQMKHEPNDSFCEQHDLCSRIVLIDSKNRKVRIKSPGRLDEPISVRRWSETELAVTQRGILNLPELREVRLTIINRISGAISEESEYYGSDDARIEGEALDRIFKERAKNMGGWGMIRERPEQGVCQVKKPAF